MNSGGTIQVGASNSLSGTISPGGRSVQIDADGTINSLAGFTNDINQLVLNGGTLSSSGANGNFGNWNFDGVSKPKL